LLSSNFSFGGVLLPLFYNKKGHTNKYGQSYTLKEFGKSYFFGRDGKVIARARGFEPPTSCTPFSGRSVHSVFLCPLFPSCFIQVAPAFHPERRFKLH